MLCYIIYACFKKISNQRVNLDNPLFNYLKTTPRFYLCLFLSDIFLKQLHAFICVFVFLSIFFYIKTTPRFKACNKECFDI